MPRDRVDLARTKESNMGSMRRRCGVRVECARSRDRLRCSGARARKRRRNTKRFGSTEISAPRISRMRPTSMLPRTSRKRRPLPERRRTTCATPASPRCARGISRPRAPSWSAPNRRTQRTPERGTRSESWRSASPISMPPRRRSKNAARTAARVPSCTITWEFWRAARTTSPPRRRNSVPSWPWGPTMLRATTGRRCTGKRALSCNWGAVPKERRSSSATKSS